MNVELRIVDRDPLGNPILEGCIFPWCRFEPGPTHRHSLILERDRRAAESFITERAYREGRS